MRRQEREHAPRRHQVPDQRPRVQELPARPLSALHAKIIPEDRTLCRYRSALFSGLPARRRRKLEMVLTGASPPAVGDSGIESTPGNLRTGAPVSHKVIGPVFIAARIAAVLAPASAGRHCCPCHADRVNLALAELARTC